MRQQSARSFVRPRTWCAVAGLLTLWLAAGANAAPLGDIRTTDLFVSGQNDYHAYRIPALVVTNSGTLLAFCEGRKKSLLDSGDIDTLLRRSTDNGKTWSKQQIIWDDQGNKCGLPCPVVDRQTGTIWLLLVWSHGDDTETIIIEQKNKEARRVYVTYSEDDGRTWAAPKEITADVKAADWTHYATGPGNGIQLTRGRWKGRLVVPCDHIKAGTKRYYSHVIYSDDHGKSWRLGGSCPRDRTNESAVVELPDGRLMLNMRNYERSRNARAVCYSEDGGATWSDLRTDETLVEPICQASILRYTWPVDDGKSRILFSNPASKKRKKLTVRLSYDEGRTWPVARELHGGPSAYSSLAILPDRSILCLYENGANSPYEKITLARFTVE